MLKRIKYLIDRAIILPIYNVVATFWKAARQIAKKTAVKTTCRIIFRLK